LNPTLVEVLRSDTVESAHRGSVVVVDNAGSIVLSHGDINALVFPRSSLKPIQTIPLLESGAAEAFELTDEEIALACDRCSNVEPIYRSAKKLQSNCYETAVSRAVSFTTALVSTRAC